MYKYTVLRHLQCIRSSASIPGLCMLLRRSRCMHGLHRGTSSSKTVQTAHFWANFQNWVRGVRPSTWPISSSVLGTTRRCIYRSPVPVHASACVCLCMLVPVYAASTQPTHAQARSRYVDGPVVMPAYQHSHACAGPAGVGIEPAITRSRCHESCWSTSMHAKPWDGQDIPKLPRSLTGNNEPIMDLAIIGNNETVVTVMMNYCY
jgi:hypothetical protein